MSVTFPERERRHTYGPIGYYASAGEAAGEYDVVLRPELAARSRGFQAHSIGPDHGTGQRVLPRIEPHAWDINPGFNWLDSEV